MSNVVRLLDRTVSTSSKGGDGGNGGDMTEARIAKLEAHVEHIQADLLDIKVDVRDIKKKQETDFRLLFSTIIFVALGLAGLLAKGFGWLK